MSSGHFGFLLLVQLGNTAVDADHGDQQLHGDDEDDCGRVMKML